MIAAFLSTLLALPALAGKPNVILIDICSIRADHMGAYGYSKPTTPEMDGLAKKSAVFDNAIAQSSWCLPNYGTLFTGQRPENHGLYVNSVQGVPDSEITLAEKLRSGGYRTAAFSGGVYMIPEWGLNRGFDTYVNIFSTAPGRIPAPVENNLPAVTDWLGQHKSSGPFFLYVAVDDLHTPYHSPDSSRFDPGYEGIAEDTDTFGVPFARAYSGEPGGYTPELAKKAAEFKKDPKHLRHYAARYDAALAEADSKVGELLRRLNELKLADDTIVIVTGDHGELLGDKGLLGHTQSLYQGVLRVPLFVRDPKRPGLAGKRFSQKIERVDLMPTILDMAGVRYDELGLQGRSLVPLLKDPKAAWRDFAFAASRRNLAVPGPAFIDERAVFWENWKLIHYLYKDRFELYDLAADPGETKDLASERPEIVSKLSFELLKQTERQRPHQAGPPERETKPSLEPSKPKN
jgi:arylsulfatase A-like enzyme